LSGLEPPNLSVIRTNGGSFQDAAVDPLCHLSALGTQSVTCDWSRQTPFHATSNLVAGHRAGRRRDRQLPEGAERHRSGYEPTPAAYQTVIPAGDAASELETVG
jgi:hypothetical protein